MKIRKSYKILKMNFEDWKKECKKIIYNQTENIDNNGLAEHNINSVDEWEELFFNGRTPLQAVEEANEDALDDYLDNQ